MTQSDLPSAEQLKQALEESGRGPLKAKELARALSVDNRDYRDFRKRLRDLVHAGDLYRVKGNRYALPRKLSLVVGRLRVTRREDAFLSPDEKGGTDVFIPAAAMDSAMDGDRVAARIESRPRGKNPVGSVVKILERARPTVVGTFRKGDRFGVVHPQDRRIPREVFVPAGSEGGARTGEVVVVRITSYGSSKMNPVGEVEHVLGPISDPGVDVLAILHGHGLPKEFPPEVERAAQEAVRTLDEEGREERTDRRDLDVFTIDPHDARDHDDALSLQPAGEGLWEIGIHIADVSHFVRRGSPVDAEALHRGTSVYLVDQVVPMLPHVLSSDRCSLRPDEDRFAVSLFAVLDDQGRVRSHRFERTVIRSRHRLHYEQVQGVLEGKESVEPELDRVLLQLRRLTNALRTLREERGSLDFDLPEARVELAADGSPLDIQKVVQVDSHRLVEDAMLLANEIVAKRALDEKLPVLYRIHEPPLQDRMEDLRDFLATLGHSLPKKKIGAKDLGKVLARVRNAPEETLVSTAILRSMNRARYSESHAGHFGLAAPWYTHFTSPIRRYPDLVVHRVVVRAFVEGRKIPEDWGGEWLETAAEISSERERVAQRAERDSVELKKIEFMERHLGDEFGGTISGVTAFGFFVLLDDFFVEGLVHVSSLEDDYYIFDQNGYRLVGERRKRVFRVGDRMKVQVARVDKEERQIDFLMLEGGAH